MSRLAAYLRVSTRAQADDGLGLDVQEQQVNRWARKHGHRIVATFRDEGLSGSLEAADRPGLAEALALIKIGRAEGLIVARLDRLARRLTIQEAALAHVWRLGGRVFAADEGEIHADDPDDPMRTAMRQMMGVFAQLERGMIVKRMSAGRRLKAERGGYAGGAPGFGYRAVNGELVPDDDEQGAVAIIRECAQRGMSTRQIAAELTSRGIRTKRDGEWHSMQVARVLQRERDRTG